MYLLTADIGGTRTRFRLLEKAAGEWRERHNQSYPSEEFSSLAEAADRYLDSQLRGKHRRNVQAAWFAVAGPVQRGAVAFTNLPWRTNAEELGEKLRVPSVHLINDLEAQAHAIPFLTENHLIPVQQGAPGNDRFLLVAAGTGLGMATMYVRDGQIEAFSSEGGHCDLAPVTVAHMELLRHLWGRFDHVSPERVLSGPGLVTLYEYVLERNGRRCPGGVEQSPMTPAGIGELASDNDPVAREAVELFVQLLGAFAGNATLQWLALGGVYLSGGAAIGLRSTIAGDSFLNTFRNKGRMRPLMEGTPVAIVCADDTGLDGVTRLAIRHEGAG